MAGVQCTFALNSKATSFFNCPGVGMVQAFSGQKSGRDNPDQTAVADIGPIPRGTYYLVDRQSGGILGAARDFYAKYGWGTTDRSEWFMLWNPNGGDTTTIHGVKRGNFRLHPMGPRRLSEGCITVVNPSQFHQLSKAIRANPPQISVPGSNLKAYGTVVVQ